MNKILRLSAALLMSFTSAGTLYAHEFQRTFALSVQEESVENVLRSFARQMGYTARFDSTIDGSISGVFNQVDGEIFFQTLKDTHQLDYYLLGSNVHFYSRDDFQQESLVLSHVSRESFEHFCHNSQWLSADLIPTYQEATQSVQISGPNRYREIVKAQLLSLDEIAKSIRVMEVFSLKYAWAEDVKIRNIGSETIVPGVASVLKAMSSKSQVTTLHAMTPLTNVSSSVEKTTGYAIPEHQPPVENEIQAMIMSDPRRNAVIITDYAHKMANYKRIIEQLDVAPVLIQIEVSIVDVDVNVQREFGINWSTDVSSGNWDTAGGSTNVPALGSGLDLTTIYTNGANQFIATARALEDQGDSKILGRPSVLTMNNTEATLESTNTFYVRTVGTDVAQLFDVTYGTTLQVTPSIVEDGSDRKVRLLIHVKDGSENPDATGADSIPVVKQTSINTQGMVAEGQGLLIGGYYYEESRVNKNGVPLLMDIPLLGYLFSSEKEVTKKMQRLILITPTVVDLDNMLTTHQHLNNVGYVDQPRQAVR